VVGLRYFIQVFIGKGKPYPCGWSRIQFVVPAGFGSIYTEMNSATHLVPVANEPQCFIRLRIEG